MKRLVKSPQFWVLCAISLTIGLFGPLQIYLTNYAEFRPNLYEFIPTFVLISACMALLAWIAQTVCGALFGKVRALALLCGLALALWLQGNILVWDYGQLDGLEIEWTAFWIQGIADLSVWLLIFGSALAWPAFFTRIATSVGVAVLLVQFVSAIPALIAYKSLELPYFKHVQFVDTDKYALSRVKNVLIFVWDTSQSDLFREVIQEDPRLSRVLDGFIFYRNAVAGFPTTFPSIPLILTGQFYDNSVPIADFIRTAFEKDSMPRAFRQNAYDVGVHGLADTMHLDEESASNLRPIQWRPFPGIGRDALLTLLDLDLFRHVPQPLKRHVYNHQDWLFAKYFSRPSEGNWNTRGFAEQFSDRTIASKPVPVFRFYHLPGMHAPLEFDENLNSAQMEVTRANYKRMVAGLLKLIEGILARLKALGIYDQTMIAMIGDHGSKINGVGTDSPGQPDQEKTIIGSGMPLLMIKPFAQRGALAESEMPVSLGDVARTVVSAAGLASALPGHALLDRAPDAGRPRVFYHYAWGKSGWRQKFLPPMIEFAVDGPVWNQESWKATCRILVPPGSAASNQYQLAQTIHFSESANTSVPYLVTGWDVIPEARGTWTVDQKATLCLDFGNSAPRGNLIMVTQFLPFVRPPTLVRQRVQVEVNGKLVDEFSADGTTMITRTTKIPASVLNRHTMRLRFVLPDAISPMSLGDAEDARRLGISVRSIAINAADQPGLKASR